MSEKVLTKYIFFGKFFSKYPFRQEECSFDNPDGKWSPKDQKVSQMSKQLFPESKTFETIIVKVSQFYSKCSSGHEDSSVDNPIKNVHQSAKFFVQGTKKTKSLNFC